MSTVRYGPAETLRPGLGGVHGEDSAVSPDSADGFCRVGGFDFDGEAVGLLGRAELTCGNVKELAFRLGVAPKTVHDWHARPKRLPAKYEHLLLAIVGARDPYFAAMLRPHALRPTQIGPSAAAVAAKLVSAGMLPKKNERNAADLVRGMVQGRLWETE